jgi:hypothetical protein
MKEKLGLLSPVLLLAALVAAACFLLEYESEYLWKVQELNLFLDTPLFLRQQMVSSGWLLAWLGSYFTEFLYHPLLGVTLICLWWAAMMAVIAGAFRIPMKWAVVLLVPLAAVLAANVELGYWVYYLKLRGHFFAATIGTTIAAASVWAFRLTPDKYYLRTLFPIASTALLYPLIGFYALLSALLMGILAWRLQGTAIRRVATSAVALLSIAFWPLCFYHTIYHQTNIVNVWWTGLPLFAFDKAYAAYYTPYYILGLSLALMAIGYGRGHGPVRRPLVWLLCQVTVAVAAVFGVKHFWFNDYNFHKELRMQRCVENLDWEGVLSEAAYVEDEPTRAIVMMKNLALFRLGTQGDKMYHYKTGAKASNTPLPLRMTQVIGRPIYYHYGQTNFCYRWCLEDGVECGWRVEYLKYLLRCSIVNGEDRVARKYIAMLKRTRYHKAWAANYERFLGNRKAVAAEAEFEPILHLKHTGDMLASDMSITEKFLMYQFIYNNSQDKLYQEQALLSALWTKDIQLFWPRFFQYATSHAGQHMPIHFQEAAYLYGHLEHQVDISGMPFDNEVVDTYNAFMQEAQQCANMSEEQMRHMLYPRFGHTFYFEYYLVRNQKLY